LVHIEHEEQLIDAHLLMLQNKWSDAAKLLEDLKAVNPSNAVFYYELSKISVKLDNQEKAVEYIDKAVSLDPDNSWYCQYAAFLFNSLNETEKELSMMEKLMALEPAKLQHYQKAAGCHVILGHSEEAVETIKRYEKKNGASVASIQERFFIYEEAQNWKKAEETLREWVSIAPSSIGALESLAALQDKRGNTKQATKTYEQILEIHPSHLEAQQYLFKTGQMSGEDRNLDWYANTSVPIDQKIGKILGLLQASEFKSIDELLVKAEATLKAHPNELKAKALRADLLFLNAEYAKALEDYHEILKEEKNKKTIFENALECAYKSGHDQYLYEIGNEMLLYFPAMLPGYYYTAVAASRKDDWNECAQLLSEATLMSKYDQEMQRKLAYLRAEMVLNVEESLSDALSIIQTLAAHPSNKAFTNYLHARAGSTPEKPRNTDIASWQPYDQLAFLIDASRKEDLETTEALEEKMHLPPELQSEKYFWLIRAFGNTSQLEKAELYEKKLQEMNSFYVIK